MSEIYSMLSRRYAESLLYVDLVDALSAYRKFFRLSSLSRILGVPDAHLSKYANGRLRPRVGRCLRLVKLLTDMNLVRRAVVEYLKSESLVDLLMDVAFTKLVALSILERLVEVFHGSRVETVITSSETMLIASHISHRLKSSLLNIHVMRGGSRTRNLGNSAVVLVMVDEDAIETLARAKAESRNANVRYAFSVLYSDEVRRLRSLFPGAVIDCLVEAVT